MRKNSNSPSGLVAEHSGFSLHAEFASKALERLSLNDKGDVIYRFKKPWPDGTTAIKLTPLELMERLAALVPRPRVHLIRFHGVLASHYKYRSEIVPKPKEQPPQVPADKNKKSSKQRIPWARFLARGSPRQTEFTDFDMSQFPSIDTYFDPIFQD